MRNLLKNNRKILTINASNQNRPMKSNQNNLWQAAIKWPLYSVAVMPLCISAGWTIFQVNVVRIDQFFIFFVAAIFLLIWENLTNDLFDSETGVDEFKFHSVVSLLGGRQLVRKLSSVALFIGILLILVLALKSNIQVLFIVLFCCLLGYLYQGPPFRLGYHGMGEPLCWLAFGPFATAASLIAISPINYFNNIIPWSTALLISSGPALATTLVLFCSHFHQTIQDSLHGKKTSLVLLGTEKASKLIPYIIFLIVFLELLPIFFGAFPPASLLVLISLPSGLSLIKLLRNYHNQPDMIAGSKFLALKFQTINGLMLTTSFILSN